MGANDDDEEDDDEFDDSKDDDDLVPVPVVAQDQHSPDDDVSPMDVDDQDLSADQGSEMDINQGYKLFSLLWSGPALFNSMIELYLFTSIV